MKHIDFGDLRTLLSLSEEEKIHLDECLHCRHQHEELATERELINLSPDYANNNEPVKKVCAADYVMRQVETYYNSKESMGQRQETLACNEAQVVGQETLWQQLETLVKELLRGQHSPSLTGQSPELVLACALRYISEHPGATAPPKGISKYFVEAGCDSKAANEIEAFLIKRMRNKPE